MAFLETAASDPEKGDEVNLFHVGKSVAKTIFFFSFKKAGK